MLESVTLNLQQFVTVCRDKPVPKRWDRRHPKMWMEFSRLEWTKGFENRVKWRLLFDSWIGVGCVSWMGTPLRDETDTMRTT